MNINFALSDYGRMQILLKLHKLFRQEKILQVSIKAYPEKQHEFYDDILTVNGKRKKLV